MYCYGWTLKKGFLSSGNPDLELSGFGVGSGDSGLKAVYWDSRCWGVGVNIYGP